MEVYGFYSTIRCWWLSLGVASEASVHELTNWLSFWNFHVRQWGGFMVDVSISPTNFLWFPLSSYYSKLRFHLYSNSICIPLPSVLPFVLWHFRFCWFLLSFLLQKFNDEEWVDMPTCNLLKMCIIYLQQLRKCGIYLYIMTSDDYICAFQQSTLYKQYLQGGPYGHGPDRNKLLLRRAQRLTDLARLPAIVANYTFGSSFTNRLPHLEGEEVVGSSKWLVNCPLNIDNDSHHLDHVNFSCPRVTILVVKFNIVGDVHM